MVIGHNIMFDLKFMAVKYGWTIRCLAYDIMLAEYFLDEERKFTKLKDLIIKYGIDTGDHKSIYEGRKISQIPYEDLTVYNGNDARACVILKRDVFDPALEEQGLTKIMGIACEAIPVLTKMMVRGINVDLMYGQQQQMKLYDKMIKMRLKLKDLAQSTFNPDSPQQLSKVLYGKFKFEAFKIGKAHGSTDYESIIRIRQEQCDGDDIDVKFIDTLIEYNKLKTMNNKYYTKLPYWVRPDGCIHTNFNLGATDTGRLTSSGTRDEDGNTLGPNMQQQKRGAEFRGVYVPRPGYTFLEGDWSAVEMRFLAHFAGETAMIEMFKQCLDVHTATMCQLKGWNYDEALEIYLNADHPEHLSIKNLRVGVKNFNFGEVYGAGIDKLQNELVKHGIYWTRKQCEDIYYEKKKLFPNIVRWKKEVANFIKKYQYVRMPFGQLRRLPDDSWGSILKGINFIIQSTASGWFPIIGMILLDRYFDENKLDAHILLSVHDSILCEVKIYGESKMEKIKKDFERIMTEDILEYVKAIFDFQLTVPLEFKTEYMERWR